MRYVLLIFAGLIENLGYLLVGPVLANYLGLIDLSKSFGNIFGKYINWEVVLTSPFLLPGMLICIFGFRICYMVLLQLLCRSRLLHLMERMRLSVLNLLRQEKHISTGTIAKFLLSDLTSSAYSYYFNQLVLASCILPFIIMTAYCIFVLGISASFVLTLWLSILFFIVSKLIKESGRLGICQNEDNIQRYEQTSEFISIAKLAVVKRIYDKRWSSLTELNRKFANNQFKWQITSATPKLLVEAFVITGILILYYFYKSVGKSPNDFLAVITLASASIYRLMPLGINLVTSFMQLRTSREQHQALENLLKLDFQAPKYLQTTDQVQLEVENLVVQNRLGTNEPLNFKIEEFGIYGFVGRSGSGKSTLSDVLSGLLSPTQGEVRIHKNHFDTNGNLNIGRSFQDPVIIQGDLKENIIFFRGLSFIDENQISQIGLDYLNSGRKLGKDQSGASLSGGEGKRVDILRTLASDSKLLIFDEPEAGLDHHSKSRMIELLKSFSKERTILVFSHDKDVIGACRDVFNLESKR